MSHQINLGILTVRVLPFCKGATKKGTPTVTREQAFRVPMRRKKKTTTTKQYVNGLAFPNSAFVILIVSQQKQGEGC
jgi:hypothetical protein